MSEAFGIDKILEYSVSDNSAQQTIITADGFKSYNDILMLGDSDIMNLVKVLSDSTVASGKISFGLLWTNLMKANIHWSQDFRRISQTSSLIGISKSAKFFVVIVSARQRARIRNHSLDNSASLSKAADPGNIKLHNNWITWSRALKNYLSYILGHDRDPLNYVISESVAPDYIIEFQPENNFK